MTVRIGISFDGFSTFGESLDTAREAETAGASSFWMASNEVALSFMSWRSWKLASTVS